MLGLAFSSETQATIVFNANTTNVEGVSNNANGGTVPALTTNANGELVVTRTGGNNSATGFRSIDDINTLNGTPLVSTDTVIYTLDVVSFTTNIQSNGIELGLGSQGATTQTNFRPANNGLFVIDDGGNNSGTATGNFFTAGVLDDVPAFGINEASLQDGFVATYTADASGVSLTVSDIIGTGAQAGATSVTFASHAFPAGTTFEQFVGTSDWYFTAQGNGGNFVIREASIEVISSIPEPGSFALIGLGSLIAFSRRRRSA